MKFRKQGRDSRDHRPALVPPKTTKDPFGNLLIESECQGDLTHLLCLFTLWYMLRETCKDCVGSSDRV